MSDQATPPASSEDVVAARIAEAAKRATAEADARRAQKDKEQANVELPPELGGPKGPEPTRYGDWEKKGIISDF